MREIRFGRRQVLLRVVGVLVLLCTLMVGLEPAASAGAGGPYARSNAGQALPAVTGLLEYQGSPVVGAGFGVSVIPPLDAGPVETLAVAHGTSSAAGGVSFTIPVDETTQRLAEFNSGWLNLSFTARGCEQIALSPLSTLQAFSARLVDGVFEAVDLGVLQMTAPPVVPSDPCDTNNYACADKTISHIDDYPEWLTVGEVHTTEGIRSTFAYGTEAHAQSEVGVLVEHPTYNGFQVKGTTTVANVGSAEADVDYPAGRQPPGFLMRAKFKVVKEYVRQGCLVGLMWVGPERGYYRIRADKWLGGLAPLEVIGDYSGWDTYTDICRDDYCSVGLEPEGSFRKHTGSSNTYEKGVQMFGWTSNSKSLYSNNVNVYFQGSGDPNTTNILYTHTGSTIVDGKTVYACCTGWVP